MDIGAKVFSSILCQQIFHIISEHGIKYQCGFMPGVHFQDGTITIKTLLHMRHNHNLPEYVTFVDIVKAFDTVNHDLLMEIFERCGAQPKLISSIIKMYKDPKNVLKIGKIRKYIETFSFAFL